MHTHPLCHVEALGTNFNVMVGWVVCMGSTLSLVVQGSGFGTRLGRGSLGYCVLGRRLAGIRCGMGPGDAMLSRVPDQGPVKIE